MGAFFWVYRLKFPFCDPDLPLPNEWKKINKNWEAHWTTLLEAAQACK